jgi:hypothetical protein
MLNAIKRDRDLSLCRERQKEIEIKANYDLNEIKLFKEKRDAGRRLDSFDLFTLEKFKNDYLKIRNPTLSAIEPSSSSSPIPNPVYDSPSQAGSSRVVEVVDEVVVEAMDEVVDEVVDEAMDEVVDYDRSQPLFTDSDCELDEIDLDDSNQELNQIDLIFAKNIANVIPFEDLPNLNKPAQDLVPSQPVQIENLVESQPFEDLVPSQPVQIENLVESQPFEDIVPIQPVQIENLVESQPFEDLVPSQPVQIENLVESQPFEDIVPIQPAQIEDLVPIQPAEAEDLIPNQQKIYTYRGRSQISIVPSQRQLRIPSVSGNKVRILDKSLIPSTSASASASASASTSTANIRDFFKEMIDEENLAYDKDKHVRCRLCFAVYANHNSCNGHVCRCHNGYVLNTISSEIFNELFEEEELDESLLSDELLEKYDILDIDMICGKHKYLPERRVYEYYSKLTNLRENVMKDLFNFTFNNGGEKIDEYLMMRWNLPSMATLASDVILCSGFRKFFNKFIKNSGFELKRPGFIFRAGLTKFSYKILFAIYLV